jgi:hypothetical protein
MGSRSVAAREVISAMSWDGIATAGIGLGTLLARHREGMPCLDYLRILGSEILGLRAFRLCILDTECRGIREMELERARRS